MNDDALQRAQARNRRTISVLLLTIPVVLGVVAGFLYLVLTPGTT